MGSTKWARVWPNVTGRGKSIDGERWISFGLVGSADILGVLLNGRLLAIECKTGAAKQTKKQKSFETMVKNFNGVYILAHPESSILVSVIKEATRSYSNRTKKWE